MKPGPGHEGGRGEERGKVHIRHIAYERMKSAGAFADIFVLRGSLAESAPLGHYGVNSALNTWTEKGRWKDGQTDCSNF